MKKLSHISDSGSARMVNVSEKPDTKRKAEAFARVYLSEAAFIQVKKNTNIKGDVLATARIAGIQAAKQTAQLIPLCHNIFLTEVNVDLKLNMRKKCIEIDAAASSYSKTGVEMEALVAASISALTVYDMCKAVDKSITITDVCLLKKTGGKSGSYVRKKKFK